jgi:hypothetical protein
VTQSPEPTGFQTQLDRLIESAASPQTSGSAELPRLEALLAAAAAPDAGPQPGELAVLASYREIVLGTPSLAARRHRRHLAVVALASTVVALGGGVAAAATGSLPGAAQSTARSMLGVVGVHVPGPNKHAGTHPDERGASGDQHGNPAPDGTEPSTPAHPAHPAHPLQPTHPAHPTTPASSHPTAPGNSGPSRHHGNPTPTATTHPAPHHGKPTAPPVVRHVHRTKVHPFNARVMRAQH